MTCAAQSSQNQDPQTYDFSCVAGDDFARQLQFVDSVTEQPIENIEEWTFYMAIYQSWQAKAEDEDPLIYIDSESGNFPVTDAAQAKLNLLIPRAETATIEIPETPAYDMNVPENVCVYDLVGVDAENEVQTQMRGTFTFQMKLTAIPDAT